MVSSQKTMTLDALLKAKRPRDVAHNDVLALFALLPKSKARDEDHTLFTDSDLEEQSPARIASIRKKRLREVFLKKYPGKTGSSARKAAVEKFRSYESRCGFTNRSLRNLRTQCNKDTAYLHSIMLMAQSKIGQILGDFSLGELLKESRWGPGTTSSCKGSKTDDATKFANRPEVSREFLGKARLCMPLLPSWSALLADTDYGVIVNPMMPLVRGNRVTFVPKTADIHRAIAVEPHINSFFQGGLGRMMRKRLMRIGIDLDDQTLNQRLAKLGSIFNDLATIDLEGASDTIAIELVRDLMPEKWFDWLNACRAHEGYLEGDWIRYEKFSSMGNGFTFDLESLIFYALSWAVCVQEGYNPFWVNTFGDDIIVPSGCYDKVCEVLAQCGLVVNPTKSFHDSPFRESCGEDYWYGHAVRPIYLKRKMRTNIEWMQTANSLYLLAHEWADRKGLDASLKTAYDFCVSRVDERLRKYKVPTFVISEFGEDWVVNSDTNGFFSNFDGAAPRIHKGELGVSNWDGFVYNGLGSTPVTYTKTSRSLFTGGVFKPKQLCNDIPYREQVSYREADFFVPRKWYDCGLWARHI